MIKRLELKDYLDKDSIYFILVSNLRRRFYIFQANCKRKSYPLEEKQKFESISLVKKFLFARGVKELFDNGTQFKYDNESFKEGNMTII